MNAGHDLPLIALTVFGGLGLLFSILSALESRVALIARFCAFFGAGCRRTADFTLFRLPISWWGAAFYAVLLFSIYLIQPLVYWLVMIAAGIELTFVWVLIAIRSFCIFCFFNALVVIGLLASVFDPDRWVLSVVVALVCFAASNYLIKRENPEELPAGHEPPPRDIETEGFPALGPPDAPVTVVEYSDYRCPACRQAHETVKAVRRQFEGRIRWVFKDLPLPSHEGAWELAEAAHCAGDQGKFWEFQDAAFHLDQAPDRETVKQMADRLGLDPEKIDQCYCQNRHRDKVTASVNEAKRLELTATPTFVINGQTYTGAPSFQDFQKAVMAHLEES